MRLRDLKAGFKGLIVAVGKGEHAYRQRLIALGLIPGTQFEVSRIAPLGDPIELTLRGFSLSLRKGEADLLEIKPL